MEATNRYLSASQPPHVGKYATGCALRVLSRTLQKTDKLFATGPDSSICR
jgi:hypothetical protein